VYRANLPIGAKKKVVDFGGKRSSTEMDKNKIIQDAWDDGYDAVELKNIQDGPSGSHNVTVVKDPSTLAGFRLDNGNNLIKSKKANGFKSEINWGKWNKEIPKNKVLMQEYSVIEQKAKTDGSWMKNKDGSKFDGSPEQFVEQNSKAFKKAYPDGYTTVYRGMNSKSPTLHKQDKFEGIFTGDERLASGYGKVVEELALKNTKKSIKFNASKDDWLDLRFAQRNKDNIQYNLDANKKHLRNLVDNGANDKIIASTKENIRDIELRLSQYTEDMANPSILN
jgi:hypothetical protein